MRFGIVVLCLSLLVIGCTSSVADVKQEDMIGEDVRVRGEVVRSVKFLGLSGYTIEDDAGDRISVSSDELPAEGEVVTASGVLLRDSLFGYYIKSE